MIHFKPASAKMLGHSCPVAFLIFPKANVFLMCEEPLNNTSESSRFARPHNGQVGGRERTSLAHRKPGKHISKGLFVTVGLLLLNTVRHTRSAFACFPCVLISGGSLQTGPGE